MDAIDFFKEQMASFERQKRIERKLDELLNKSEYITIAGIAEDIGRSKEWIRRHPWVLPNFGRPDIDGRPKQWLRSNWDEWKEHLNDRRIMWEAMANEERETALGIDHI